MTRGLIIFAIGVGLQAFLFVIGLILMCVYLYKTLRKDDESDKLYYIASLVWVIANLCSITGAVFRLIEII